MAAIPETKYAMAGDAHIAYQVFGQGETDLVWMPHWATHLEMLWEDPLSAAFFQGLASFSRVILFDKRGVGLSDPVALAAPLTVESCRRGWVTACRGGRIGHGGLHRRAVCCDPPR